MGDKVIGIDLGTTNTCASILLDGRVQLILTQQHKRLLPSAVFFDKKTVVVGESAILNGVTSFRNLITETKRLMGQKYSDVKHLQKQCQYKIRSGKNQKAVVIADYKETTTEILPEEIAAVILRMVKRLAEKMLNGEKVNKAVISIPAHFTNAQREATLSAGKIAGLDVLKLIAEPTAAALCYIDALELDDTKEKIVLVYDLGGGTLDVSIVKFQGSSIKILGIEGDSHLGGADFTNNLTTFVINEVKRKHPNVEMDTRLLRRIIEAAGRAKVELSSLTTSEIDLLCIANNEDDFTMTITRKEFEDANEDLFAKTIDIVDACIFNAGLQKSQIDEIILAGGSSRIPKVSEMLKDYFNQKLPSKSVNPDEAIAIGAAIQAALLSTDPQQKCTKYIITDVLPESLGIETFGGKMSFLLRKNCALPAKATNKYTNRENQSMLSLSIYRGENEFVDDNTEIASLTIGNITPAPEKSIIIEITFMVNENGILNVSVKENGKSVNNLEIKLNTGTVEMGKIGKLLENESDTLARTSRSCSIIEDS